MEKVTFDDFQEFFASCDALPKAQAPEQWDDLVAQCTEFVPIAWYKSMFIDYQTQYFSEVCDSFFDLSMVLQRGGRCVGIWPLCLMEKNGEWSFGTCGGPVLSPILPVLPKPEGQRAVFEKCLLAMEQISAQFGISQITFSEISMEGGVDEWEKKLMERGAIIKAVKHQLFADLSLNDEEIRKKIRPRYIYRIAQGKRDYEIEVYDEKSENIDEAFRQLHQLHRKVSGRETRGQKTWDLQKKNVEYGNAHRGHSFVVLMRDKESGCAAGGALFDATPQCCYYCVGAFDRERFANLVGHIVHAVAMKQMQDYGIRWFQVGERPYITDEGADDKTVNIGYYKEGFATHTFPQLIFEWTPTVSK